MSEFSFQNTHLLKYKEWFHKEINTLNSSQMYANWNSLENMKNIHQVYEECS